MIDNTYTFLAIGMISLILLATRLGGEGLMSKVRITPKVETFLESMSGSVIIAIVASEVAHGGFRTLGAVMLTGALMLISKNGMIAMFAGVGLAAAWRLFA